MDRSPQVGDNAVSLTFAANMRFVRPLRHFITALCELACYDEDEQESIALVTTELLNNSIEHGSFSAEDEIGVTMVVTENVFSFEVVDSGRGGASFATGAQDRAEKRPDFEEPRGRGLFLINNYMDEMVITYDPDVGTRFRVAKARKP